MIRVLLPALFWLPAYWVFRWFMLHEVQRPQSIEATLNWAIKLFEKEGVSVHLWFVYMILLLYIFVPFIARILKNLSQKSIIVFLLIWLIVNQLQLFGLFSTRSFPLLFQKLYNYLLYTGYLVLGYVLQTSTFSLSRKFASGLYMLTIVVATAASWYLSMQAGKQTLTVMNTFSVNTFAQVIAFYYLFKNIEFKNKYLSNLIEQLSNYSFGIYLVHIMIISLFYRVGIFWTMAHPLISVPVVVALTLITSFTVIFLLRKIPFLAKFAG